MTAPQQHPCATAAEPHPQRPDPGPRFARVWKWYDVDGVDAAWREQPRGWRVVLTDRSGAQRGEVGRFHLRDPLTRRPRTFMGDMETLRAAARCADDWNAGGARRTRATEAARNAARRWPT